MNRLKPGSIAVTTAVVRQQAVVGRRDQRAIGPLEHVDVSDLDDVGAEIVADGLDHAVGPVLIDAAGPANQEFADVVERDRILLAGVVLDHQPPRGRVDDFAPGPLRRKLRKAARMPDDLVKGEPADPARAWAC